jgi:hypothetical protein
MVPVVVAVFMASGAGYGDVGGPVATIADMTAC